MVDVNISSECRSKKQILHTRLVAADQDGICIRWDGRLTRAAYGGSLPSLLPGWQPDYAIGLGQDLVVLGLRAASERAFWVLDGEGRFVGNDPTALIESQAYRLTDADQVLTTGSPQDLAADLVDWLDLVRGSFNLADIAVLKGSVTASKSLDTAALATITSLFNARFAGTSSIFQHRLAPDMLEDGGVNILYEGETLVFDFFLPISNFWYAAFCRRLGRRVLLLLTQHQKVAIAAIDIDGGGSSGIEAASAQGMVFETMTSLVILFRLIAPVLEKLGHAQHVGVVLRESHIGHYVWNELAAIDRLERLGLHPRPFLLKTCTEPVFRVDEIFPSTCDLVIRGAETFRDFLPYILSGDTRFLPFTELHITAALAKQICVLAQSSEDELDRRLADLRRQRVIVLIGLRLENRCWLQQQEGYITLARRLDALEQGRFALVFDGHNRQGSEFVRSYCEDGGGEEDGGMPRIIARELQLVNAVTKACHFQAPGVEIYNLIPCSIAASIVASLRAHYFATHWGAGLAKYKWIANAPGCVISSRSVLEDKGDLHIYDKDEFRGGAIQADYISTNLVTDARGVDLLVRTFEGGPDRDNFLLDPEAFAEFVISQMRQRGLIEEPRS